MQCQMLLVNSETVEDKWFPKSVSTGLIEFIGFNISQFVDSLFVTGKHNFSNTQATATAISICPADCSLSQTFSESRAKYVFTLL